MSTTKLRMTLGLLAVLTAGLLAKSAYAGVYVQCPGDTNGDAVIDNPDPKHPNAKCMHLTGGDGFIKMAKDNDADNLMYIFGFSNVTGIAPDKVLNEGTLGANFPAPTIELKEGQEFYLTLTNVGMAMRPDLFDAHTVHFHGYPNAASVMDGEPTTSLAIGMGSSLTYYYNVVEPGTYMYHCHVEAAEHMQMGMLGNLYVHPRQDGAEYSYRGKTYKKFVYNDNDGSTGYDVEYALQLSSMDKKFHEADLHIQPVPFANMKDDYFMINGRGYPDTVNTAALKPLPTPASDPDPGKVSQKMNSLITATAGQRILMRLTNLSITDFFTVTALGLPMKVVGNGNHIMRGPTGKDLYYDTGSLTLGGGEAFDVMIDTTGIKPGTYYFYTTNLNYLSNSDEDYGGIMTEIVIN